MVEGSSFCISDANGDIHPERPSGVFFQDTRILSGWILTVNGQALEPLAAETKEPYRALFAARVPRSDGYADSPLIVERLREVGAGIQEQVTVRNYSVEPAECLISLKIEADFADLFEVKEARIQRHWDQTRHVEGDSLTIRAAWQDIRKGIIAQAAGAGLTPEGFTYRVAVAPHGQWSTILTVVPSTDAASPPPPSFVHTDAEGLSPRDLRRREWVAKIPVLHMGNRSIERTLRRSYDDLGVTKRQQRTAFALTWGASVAALLILVAGSIVALRVGDENKYITAGLTALGTLLSAFLGKTFFKGHEKAMEQLNHYYLEPSLTGRLLAAERILDQLPAEERHKKAAEIMNKLLDWEPPPEKTMLENPEESAEAKPGEEPTPEAPPNKPDEDKTHANAPARAA